MRLNVTNLQATLLYLSSENIPARVCAQGIK